MIVDLLLGWVFGIIGWLVDLFPSWDLGLPSFGGALDHLADFNYFLPMGELFAAVLAVILLGPAFLIATLTTWLAVGVIRGGNPRA